MTITNSSLELDILYSNSINYAIQQNRISLVRNLNILNTSDVILKNITIKIYTEPNFTNEWSNTIDVLNIGERFYVDTSSLKLSASFLAELTEKIRGELIIKISTTEDVLLEKRYSIDVLAFDQWSGSFLFPEILSAFVTPNNPSISKILVNASSILNKWTENPALNAYQSLSPDRVKKQIGATFEALKSLELIYASPPASFENYGQRIRTCDVIFSQKITTCLDSTILFASCLEAIGLHPIIVLIKGHAFVGCWLIDSSFSDSFNNDVSFLKNRIANGINEICLIETTFINAGSSASFEEAIKEANHHILNDVEFDLFIDVKRSRLSNITPLPQRIKTEEGWSFIEDSTELKATKQTESPTDIKTHDIPLQNNTDTIVTKQKIWERKLLDLSLRNNLLNLRSTNSNIQLLSTNLSLFEDALAEGKEFVIDSKPKDFQIEYKELKIQPSINLNDPISKLLEFDLSKNILRTYLTDNELSNSINKLYKSSKLSLEENGANTLFLALGFLKWYESPTSEVSRYAPLLLIPIEIIKKSAKKGFVIRSREEETIINITLLEMLKQDFDIRINGLTKLPLDESGVDVPLVFNIIRKAIINQNRWSVEEQAFIGSFSFSKFVMWNDIHSNSEKLINNKIVKSLVDGKLSWEPKTDKLIDNIDELYHPNQNAIPISADATQLKAIFVANNSRSFILHGPPGTGKSQTITNIIANALYHNKKVLFVAEKMAALTVVQKRLSDIGLAPFCMELHSNKSKKSTILQHLEKTSEITAKTSPKEFQRESERLLDLRVALNDFNKQLHKKQHYGLSLYDCFENYQQLPLSTSNLNIDSKFIHQTNDEKLENYFERLKELETIGEICNHPYKHPLSLIKTTSYSKDKKENIKKLLKVCIVQTTALTEQKTLIIEHLGIEKNSIKNLNELVQILQEIQKFPETPSTLLSQNPNENDLNKIINISSVGIEKNLLEKEITEIFSKKAITLEAELLLNKWNKADHKWFIPKFFEQKKITKQLNSYSKLEKISNKTTPKYLSLLNNYQEKKIALQNKSSFLNSLLGLNIDEINWEETQQYSKSSLVVYKLLFKILKDTDAVATTMLKIPSILKNGVNRETNELIEIFIRFETQLANTTKTKNELDKLLCFNSFLLNQSVPLKEEIITFKEWENNLDKLKDWINWNIISDKVKSTQLSFVVDAYVNGEFKNNDVLNSFKKCFYEKAANQIIENNESLSVFNGQIFTEKINSFKEQQEYFTALSKAELISKLSAKIPSFENQLKNSSEMGILQKAIRSKGRGISLRNLFDSIPNLLEKMSPCMLMSPISVAQYLEVDQTKFDLVIFDEASQMPTCEAVGAIARGKNTIIVGDPKQMPPTSFFSSNYFDEENADKEDLESILDDCLALSMPSQHLLWHYRSKHESLISFSNQNYYDNKLLTYPSPDDLSNKVTNVYIDGYYDRGKTRQNHFEAKAIVKEILTHYEDPVLSKKSIGVVTFSSAQQTAIEDLLNEAFKKNPLLEDKATKNHEPLFVKNLENVQGDERDIILFSIGYGPDKQGKVYLNFGPINREGGWRRLNVAVSRSRYEMKVFTTLKSEQIDLRRTNKDGIVGFKKFLEFTEKGSTPLINNSISNKSLNTTLLQSIAKEIETLGYNTQVSIGKSHYKIDIGVIDKQNPSKYLFGILTDGYTYNFGKTANDRNNIQPSVLKSLGWNILKIWSLDWWENKSKVMDEIKNFIKNIEENKIETVTKTHNTKPITQEIAISESLGIDYINYELDIVQLNDNEDFFDPIYHDKIFTQISNILETESPISKSLLFKKVINAWSINRVGTRIDNHLKSITKRLSIKETEQNGQLFYWKANQSPHDLSFYRLPSNVLKRGAEDLPKEEVWIAIKEVLNNQISISEKELIKETAKLFGYSRTGKVVEQSMKNGINYGKSINSLTMNNENYILHKAI